MEGEVVKTKRAPSEWAIAVSKHMKAGGKFPKKGTADYDAVKAMMGKKEEKPKAQTPKDKEDEKLGAEVAVLKRDTKEPKKTARSVKAKTVNAVVADIAKESIVKAEKVLPIAEVPDKPKRKRVVKPKTEAAPEISLPAKDVKIDTGIELPIAHIIPMMRVGATHSGIKLPFNLK